MGNSGIPALIAGLLLVAAVAVTSMRWMRIFALAAGVAGLAVVQLVGLGTLGNLIVIAFVVVNGVQLVLLELRTRRHHLTAEERELLEGVLQVQDPEQQRRLIGLMRWRDAEVDEMLLEQGDSRPPLIYVASGEAEIIFDGKSVGTCSTGDFIGEMSLMTGERASATVRVSKPLRMARFDRDGLAQFTRSVPELQRAFDAALNRGMVAKITRMNKAAAASTQ